MDLDTLQTTCQARIEADPWITAKKVAVVSSVKGDVESKVKTIVAKLGICVIIEPAVIDIRYANNSASFNGELLNFFIYENVLINRGPTGTGATAVLVGAKLIHLFKPSSSPPAAMVITKFQPWDTSGKMLAYLGRGEGVLKVDEPVLPEEPAP
jgi:hypothetical protein